MDLNSLITMLGLCTVVAPALLLAALGLPSLLGAPLNERTTARLTYAAVIAGLLSSILILGMMLISGTRHVEIVGGDWVRLPGEHFHFTIKLVFDRLSVPFAILSFTLCGTVGAFASRYLHQEPGFNRFFVFYALFLLGMILASLAGTIETLFTGWELVGLSSALLVAFFWEREAPVRNGLWIWCVYRISDAALLVGAIALHHMTGEGDFARLTGAGAWPDGIASLTQTQALVVGLLLLVAAAGKSALVPFAGWLPRAMEGPTPSSAIFYGALSVHLGAFLLLRVSPILELSPVLCGLVVALGLATAAFGALAERVQMDIKSALAFASVTQIGLIVAEIGLGLRYIALIHIIGHACLRTLQFLRAPTLLHDYHLLENAIGSSLPRRPSLWRLIVPDRARLWFYRFALERGYLDGCLERLFVAPFLKVFGWCDRLEQSWREFLSGDRPIKPAGLHPQPQRQPADEQHVEQLSPR